MPNLRADAAAKHAATAAAPRASDGDTQIEVAEPAEHQNFSAEEGAAGEAAGAQQGASKATSKDATAKGARARDGGHANFVRMASQKGKSSFRYKSKSGSKIPKNRKWAARKMAQESLPAAGLGADSTRETNLVRYSDCSAAREVHVLASDALTQPASCGCIVC